MKFNFFKRNNNSALVVLLCASTPRQAVLDRLAHYPSLTVREAFTSRGILQSLPGVQLVILGDPMLTADAPIEMLQRTLKSSGVPLVSQEEFLADPEEWIGRARLASASHISFLPARQINLINWSGGVGKTTLAMALCKRFVQRTGLPAALLELSLGGSALHARISTELPEFFSIATHKAEAALWQGVSLYPMDGRTIDVLWSENPDGVRQVLADIRSQHTLFAVDAFPGHALFPELSRPLPGRVNLVVTSPRDDAVYQARRLMSEVAEPRHLVLNMARSMADRAETGVSVVLPYHESRAQSLDARLADPLLELVYTGWKGKGK